MKQLLLLTFSLFFISFLSTAQLTGVVMEEVMNSETFYDQNPGSTDTYPEGYATYRIYAELQDPEDFVSSVFAIQDCWDIEIKADNSFWNSQFGGLTGPAVNSAFFMFFPDLEWDSYVTIGRSSNLDPGDPISTVSSNPAGFWNGPNFVSSVGTTDVHLYDGAWFITSNVGAVNGLPVGPNNRVLLAQLTTAVPPEYKLNLMVIDDQVQGQEILYVGSNPNADTQCSSGTEVVNGISLGLNTLGCNDLNACNYNPESETNLSCDYPSGCYDVAAQNYDPSSTCEAECIYGDNPNSDCATSLSISANGGSFLVNTFGSTSSATAGTCWSAGSYNITWLDFTASAEDMILNIPTSIGDIEFALFDACNGNEIECGVLTSETWIPFTGLTSSEDYYLILNTADAAALYVQLIEGHVGCTNVNAPNYDEDAIFNDGTCIVYGCMNPEACNFNLTANEDDGSCELPDGCTDMNAVNFDPDAICNDGSCLYEGCTDPDACNFNQLYNLDDGSCYESGTLISGVVYLDSYFLTDGSYNSNFEPVLSNRAILIEPINELIYTDDGGNWSFHAEEGVSYYISLQNDDPNLSVLENSVNVAITGQNCWQESINLGLTVETATSSLNFSPLFFTGQVLHCTNGLMAGNHVYNSGSTVLHGTITLSFDPVLSAESTESTYWLNPSSISSGECVWEFEDIDPGSSLSPRCHINAPGMEYLGDMFNLHYSIVVYDETETEVYSHDFTTVHQMVCAYDPNDKQANPEGYGEPHYILPNDEVEYRIRFQNTGNYFAEDIVIRDTLDIEHLDLSTFTPKFASHDFSTCVQLDNGVVDFIFENIMLPDSTSDLEGSQGFVVYSVQPKEDILPGDVIENTAYIYFDENPAIVTNTTWHTIYDCNELFVLGDVVAACQNDVTSIEVEYPYIERFDWYVDEELVDSDGGNSFDLSTLDPGDYTIGLTAENPLCEAFSTSDVSIYEVPVADFSADDAVLTAADGDSWQWYFNGEEIDGATDQSYTATESGNYSVMITNANDCSDISVEQNITIIGVEEHNAVALSIFPNPATDLVNIKLSGNIAPERIEIYDQTGKLVLSKSILNSNSIFTVDCCHLSAGVYVVNLIDNKGQAITSKLEIK